MSTIEAILAGSERVKGRERVKGCSVPSPSCVILRKSARILRRIIVTLYIYIYIDKNFNGSTTVCSLARYACLLSISIAYHTLLSGNRDR